MSSTLTQNFFELFSLPQRYALERADLDARYRDLQRTVHPDRHASAGDQQRRMAMQQAAHINEAYQTLKDPLRRARYLLELRGHVIEDQQTTHQDPEFLMQQIELREALAEIREQDDPLQALDRLARDIRAQYHALESDLAEALDSGAEIEQAVTLVLKMQYFTRLQNEVQELEADLEDELY
ncbi:MAG TPA: Fe-S protein assembly co-chaperone HscB [Gammaproteobacteria bacterium]|nr:Fe-S protein assembly co-chaperone HscB [Gammaproteobacteria bacterium]